MRIGLFATTTSKNVNETLKTYFTSGKCEFISSAQEFLHGYCMFFALALYELYNYSIKFFIDSQSFAEDSKEWNCNPMDYLVHCFCYDYNSCLFFDVRGGTESSREFFEEFSDFIDRSTFLCHDLDYEELKFYAHSSVTKEEYDTLLSEAKSFIEKHPVWYKMN